MQLAGVHAGPALPGIWFGGLDGRTIVPGRTNGERTTAPTCPPPAPPSWPAVPPSPGFGLLGPGISLQQAAASKPWLSSTVMTSMPSCRNAGDAVIIATYL